MEIANDPNNDAPPVELVETPSTQVTPTEPAEEPAEEPSKPLTVGDALKDFELFDNSTDEFSAAQPASTEQPVAPIATTTPQQSPAVTQPATPAARIFDGLEPDEVVHFKKMSNNAYNYLYPLLLEHKKIKNEQLPQLRTELDTTKANSFYEHEEAYTVLPEYRELQGHAARLGGELSHWENQLANIEAGEKWIPLGWDNQQNMPYADSNNAQEASPQARAFVLSNIQKAISYQSDAQNQIRNFGAQFKVKHQDYTKALQSAQDRIFSGVDQQKLKQAAEQKMQIFPKYTHGRPEIQALSKALVMIDGLLANINKMRGSQRTTQIKAGTAQVAGPIASAIQSGASNGKTVGSIIDEFESAHREGIL